MRRKSVKIILLAALILIVGVSFGTMYTNAKYTSTVTGQASASVAKYVFNVSAKDSYKTADTISNLTLAKTCNASTLANGKIAPGTSGSFDIILNANGSDVAIGYEVTFAAKNTNKLPTNLKLKLDGADWDFSKKITGTINAGTTEDVKRTVTWNWEYETEGGDTQDTIDGQSAFNFVYDITVIGTQVRPA